MVQFLGTLCAVSGHLSPLQMCSAVSTACMGHLARDTAMMTRQSHGPVNTRSSLGLSLESQHLLRSQGGKQFEFQTHSDCIIYAFT